MVSKASDDFPEPESPVITTRRSRGISRLIFLRLCSRAPRIISLSAMTLRGPFPRRVASLDCPRGIFDGRNHTGWIRDPTPGNLERRAVVGRSPNKWQSDGHVHSTIKLQGLERDQALIVIHSHSRIEAESTIMPNEGGIGRERPVRIDAAFDRAPNRRRDDANLLVAEESIFTPVGIEAEHADAWICRAFILAQMPIEHRDGVEDIFLRQQARHLREAHMDGHQGHPKFASCEHHAPVFGAPDLRHHLAMPGKMMARAIPPLLANGRGDESIHFAITGHPRTDFDVLK